MNEVDPTRSPGTSPPGEDRESRVSQATPIRDSMLGSKPSGHQPEATHGELQVPPTTRAPLHGDSPLDVVEGAPTRTQVATLPLVARAHGPGPVPSEVPEGPSELEAVPKGGPLGWSDGRVLSGPKKVKTLKQQRIEAKERRARVLRDANDRPPCFHCKRRLQFKESVTGSGYWVHRWSGIAWCTFEGTLLPRHERRTKAKPWRDA